MIPLIGTVDAARVPAGSGGSGFFQPTVTPNTGTLGSYSSGADVRDPSMMIDGSNLSLRNETGLFDQVATEWASAGTGTSGTIRFDLSTPRIVEKFYAWRNNFNTGGSNAVANQCPRNFRIKLIGNDGTTIFYTSPVLTMTKPIEGVVQSAQVFSFPATANTRYIDWEIQDNYGSLYVSIGEIGFS